MIALVAGFVLVLSPRQDAAAATCPAPTGTDRSSSISDVHLLVNGTRVPDGGEVTVSENQGMRLAFDFAPGAVESGDYLQYQLPSVFRTPQGIAVPAFDIPSSSGAVVGCGEIDSNGLVTIVFNDTAAQTPNLTGSFHADVWVTAGVTDEPVEVPVHLSDTAAITITVNPGAGPAVGTFRKEGWYTFGSGTIWDAQRLLSWRIVTPEHDQDLTNVVISDVVGEGEEWVFNCDEGRQATITTTPADADLAATVVRTECTETSQTWEMPRIPAGTTVTLDPIPGQGARR
ncbi:MAG: hypothetical protein GXX86_03525 [Propionibacterium sp.]|nr:hypothetical protein [Propionibacterium sp.]